MWNQIGIFGLTAVLALVVACGTNNEADEPASAPDERQPGSSAAAGPGLTVAEAKASELDGPLLVNGFIVASGTT